MKRPLLMQPVRSAAAFAVSAILVCGCLMPFVPAHAVTAAEMAAEAENTYSQLTSMQQTLDEASDNYLTALTEYSQAVEKREETTQRIEEITGEIEDIQDRLGNRAREMYRNGSTSFVDLLLGATSFDEFTQNWDLLNRVNETDAELSVKAKDLREEQREQEAVLKEQEKVAQERSDSACKAFEEAQAIVEQLQATYDSLSAEAQAMFLAEQGATGGIQNDDGTVTDIATGQVYSSAAAYSMATGNAVVDRAMAMLGSAYQWGGTGANGAFDCSGLVGYALTGTHDRIGNTITFMGWNQVSDPQPGDICVNSGHTGIYIGDGQMVHAADENTGVVVGNVQSGMIYVRP